MYENDPDAPNRPPLGDPADSSVSPRMALGTLLALGIIALAFAFWPGRDSNTQVSEKSPAYRAPTSPPVITPADPPTIPPL